jgi:excisionase family DNA binding protein
MQIKENPCENTKVVLTPMDSARLLGISLRKIYYYMEDGTLPFYRLPNNRRRYLKREEVLGLLQEAA